MDILGDTKFDFLGKKRGAFFLSGFLVIIGLIALVEIVIGRANLGIDFAGGASIQLKFKETVRIDAARELLSEGLKQDIDLQEFPLDNKLLIRLKEVEGGLGTISDRIKNIFKQGFPENDFTVEATTEIGPTVGKRLQKDAMWAISIALLGILAYIAWRFEFRFGIAAVIATFHDVLAVLGILTIMNKEINLLIITALLTIAGYSLNDTVVIFDRIREDLRVKSKASLEDIINMSINEVLRRTIITSLTTLLAVIALLSIGGEVLHDFSFALFLGVIIGTYSSIFVASPLLFLWKGKRGRLIRS
ncbi:MAG: protein translocase subunit SecF [Thermodesulfobacteriota bacterium]